MRKRLIADNFIFAFNFIPPMVGEGKAEPHRILFLHSVPLKQTEICLSRLINLYPESEFVILKREEAPFLKDISSRISFLTYPQKNISSDLCSTEVSTLLIANKFDLVFFCIPGNFHDVLTIEICKNIIGFLKQMGYADISYVIDNCYSVNPLSSFQLDITVWTIGSMDFHLPWTLMFQEELEELYGLACRCPSEGAIVNIGHFMGGSAITLARGSKLNGRGKVYSYDTLRFNWSKDTWRQNQVEDWIIFKQKGSEEAAKEWGMRNDTRISLLFIDGDHSYENCRKDIVNWSPYLCDDGIIAVHDYCHVDNAAISSLAGVTRAVYDTILPNSNYQDFKQAGSIFVAKKSGASGNV